MKDFDILEIIKVLRGILVIIAGLGCLWFWCRTRLWLPVYIHVMALFALALGFWMITTVPKEAPLNAKSIFFQAFLIMVFPAIVYFFFVIFGGQQAAYKTKLKKYIICSHCKEIIRNDQSNNDILGEEIFDLNQYCPFCGITLG